MQETDNQAQKIGVKKPKYCKNISKIFYHQGIFMFLK